MQIGDLVQEVFGPLQEKPASSAATQEFVVLSRAGTPRWLLPKQHHKIDPLLASWSPYRLQSRLKWGTIRAANRAGVLSALPGAASVSMADIGDVDWRTLGWQGDAPPVIAVYLGTPGPSRKAVIHLADAATGVCRVIVKVPLAEAAKSAILHEADVLTRLAVEGYTCAPHLLSFDRERGISGQTVLRGRPGCRKFTPGYVALLHLLALNGESTSLAEHSEEWRRLLWAASRNSDGETLMAAVAELCDPRPLPAYWVHGDFSPWNLKHLPDGRAGLLDWEDAHRGGLPLQDAFHFLHMQDYLFEARPTIHSHQLTTLADSLHLTGEQVRKLEMAYLTSSCLRRLGRQELEHAEFLLQTLNLALRGRDLPARERVGFTAVAPA